jgi:transcriptional regulator with XRE-family HTH domain
MTKKSQFNRLPETMEAADVGPYLRGLREHYKLSEQDVSARLHIRVKYIQAIEAGAVDQLPGKVYARGHIASYAEFLGVDPDQAAEKLLGSDAAPKKQEFFVPEPMRAGQRPRIGLWLGLLMIGAVMYFLMRPSAEAPPPDVAPVPDALVDNARTLIMPTGNMLRCAAGENLGACIIRASGLAGGQPLAAPDIFTAATPWDGRAAPVPAAPAPAPNDAADTPRVIRPGAEEKPAISESPESPSAEDLPWLRKPAAEEAR